MNNQTKLKYELFKRPVDFASFIGFFMFFNLQHDSNVKLKFKETKEKFEAEQFNKSQVIHKFRMKFLTILLSRTY